MPPSPVIEPRIAESFALQGLMQTVGARLVEGAGGRCVVEADWSPGLTQQDGFFHAGLSTAIADTAAGYAALSVMPQGASVLSVEFKVNLLNPARGQRLRATAQVIKPGRTLVVVKASVEAINDGVAVHCAEFQGTMFCLAGR